jgi:hypothetical protein
MSHRVKYTVKWTTFAILAIAIFLPSPVQASAEGGVIAEIRQIVIEAREAGYKITLSTDDKNFLHKIKVEWGGNVAEFGVEAFGQVESPDFGSYYVRAPTENSRGKQDHVILILPYNQNFVKEGDESYNQWDFIRIHFNKGRLEIWQKAEAVIGKPGKWKLTSKGEMISDVVDGVDRVDKNGVYDNGNHTSKKNPYAQ